MKEQLLLRFLLVISICLIPFAFVDAQGPPGGGDYEEAAAARTVAEDASDACGNSASAIAVFRALVEAYAQTVQLNPMQQAEYDALMNLSETHEGQGDGFRDEGDLFRGAGYQHMLNGDWGDAVDDFEAAYEIPLNGPPTGKYALALERYGQAISDLDQALAILLGLGGGGGPGA